MVMRPPSAPAPTERSAELPATKRELLTALRDLVGEVAEVPPERRSRLLQSLSSALQPDLELLYGVLAFLHESASAAGALRRRGACACGTVTTIGLLCPRCGTVAE